ncbi:MAG: hypothetical protein WB870_11595 [Gallionellaceae bacterium]
MTSNGHLEFRSTTKLRATNEFSSHADVSEVLAFIREQKVPGELVISLPGNGGVSGIVFREKERAYESQNLKITESS